MSPLEIKELVKNRFDKKVSFVEPWQACDANSDEAIANAKITLTVNDCINLQRLRWRQKGLDHRGQEEELLEEFLAVHWGQIEPT